MPLGKADGKPPRNRRAHITAAPRRIRSAGTDDAIDGSASHRDSRLAGFCAGLDGDRGGADMTAYCYEEWIGTGDTDMGEAHWCADMGEVHWCHLRAEHTGPHECGACHQLRERA